MHLKKIKFQLVINITKLAEYCYIVQQEKKKKQIERCA